MKSNQWRSFQEFFQHLNKNCNYVILRNWESLLHNENDLVKNFDFDSDIDILCDNLEIFLSVSKAEKANAYLYSSNYVVCISNKLVNLDVRYIGDGYYSKQWEVDILNKRVFKKKIFIVDESNFFYTYAYHVLIHKKNRAENILKVQSILGVKINRFLDILHLLREYCKQRGYKVAIPKDPGVYFNWINVMKLGISIDFNNIFIYFFSRVKRRL